MVLRNITVAEMSALCGKGDLVIQADNLVALPHLPQASFQLIYIDPPFNTGQVQKRTGLRTIQDAEGDRIGFAGRRYRTEAGETATYGDRFEDYLGFLRE